MISMVKKVLKEGSPHPTKTILMDTPTMEMLGEYSKNSLVETIPLQVAIIIIAIIVLFFFALLQYS